MTERAGRTFAERLDHLFKEVHPDKRGPYTYAEVAAAIEKADGGITASGIQQLRTGKRVNPKMETIKALAGFFGVPAGYFFDDEVAEHTEAEIKLAAAMRDQKIAQVAMRSAGLSTASLKMVHTVIQQARHLEGLPLEDDFQDLDLNE
ncbi:helix-turn-helix domain-containing protein [Streptomyces sp. NPDC127040]|uniref:helix-turn-helix domain-containing protein n=1 Tax=Streptomyces sp. NPDC127040 TaxID=3347116 RepID=UPI003655EE09